jgi:8-oxo-dGTP diphosphatase
MKYLQILITGIKMLWYDMFSIPKASLVLIIDSKGKILSVSRKDNSKDKNIVGGKVDKGETFIKAAIREAKEETGLDVYDLMPIFFRKDGVYKCVTFIAKYKGEISKTSETETGVVGWIFYDELFNGSFGDYNKELKNVLKKINIILP